MYVYWAAFYRIEHKVLVLLGMSEQKDELILPLDSYFHLLFVLVALKEKTFYFFPFIRPYFQLTPCINFRSHFCKPYCICPIIPTTERHSAHRIILLHTIRIILTWLWRRHDRMNWSVIVMGRESNMCTICENWRKNFAFTVEGKGWAGGIKRSQVQDPIPPLFR